MKDVSEESLLDYFYTTGGNSGRVKNADILKTFKPFIGHSDLQLRAKYREEFKLIIDRIAVVKSENGEKFLVLKKKFRQQLQDRDSRAQGGEESPAQTGDSAPASSSASAPVHTAQWDSTQTSPTKTEPSSTREEPMECGEAEGKEEQLQESESEQDEESTGSMGSASVALDPVEKEWIYSAAGARVPDLSHLLRQDPTLANKKDFTSGIT